MDAFRQQLDELMGKDRNLLPHEKNKRGAHFSDPEICKYYICGFCPSDLFTNTKSDLGPCHKVHDEQCREMYAAEKNKSDFPFEAEWIHHLERLVQDLDRKIKKAHDRLDTQDMLPDSLVAPENKEKVENITNQIQSLLNQMEQLGEEGRVDESQALMRVVDKLKAEKEILLRGGTPGGVGGIAMGQEKKMRVCETCGAFLVVGDTEKRMASHVDGKQHQGYAKIRAAIDDFHKRRDEEAARRKSSGGYRDFDRERDRERDRGRDRDRFDRDGGRGGYRDNRDNRDRDRRDSRDYNRDNRDRERDRDRHDDRRENKRKYNDDR